MRVSFTHWFPMITWCPDSIWPDLIYITITFDDNKFRNLYDIRKELRRPFWDKKLYMEEVAAGMQRRFPEAAEVEVRLVFGKHRIVTRKHP